MSEPESEEENELAKSPMNQFAVTAHDGRLTQPSDDDNVFPVSGAGFVAIGPGRSRCGGAWGISFDVSWSKWGYSGGVMDVADVIRLRNFLNRWLDSNPVIVANVLPTGQTDNHQQ